MAAMLRDHRRGASASVREGEQGGEADVLGADDHRPAPRHLAPLVDQLLEHARRHHPLGPRARHQPGGARALATSRGQDDRAGIEKRAPRRAGELEGAVIGPASHLCLRPHLGAGGGGAGGDPSRVARSRH
jgi:hypothetical protein